MLERNAAMFMVRLFLTAADLRTFQESLADCVCYRCKRIYRHHCDADHRFFEYAEDLDPEEAN